MRCIVLTVVLTAVSAVALGHHSVAALYDFSDVQEITGVVTNVAWVNPHIRLSIDVDDGAGSSA